MGETYVKYMNKKSMIIFSVFFFYFEGASSFCSLQTQFSFQYLVFLVFDFTLREGVKS